MSHKKEVVSDELLHINGESLRLRRPGATGRSLRAWDAADEQLLEQAQRLAAELEGPKTLVLDDQFGALTYGLQALRPVSVADSATLATALALNCSEQAATAEALNWSDVSDARFDLAVVRIPRQLDYLAWLLRWLNQRMAPDGVIIAGGMIKHLPDRSADLFGELVHTQTVCPAKKKARVIIAKPGSNGLEGWEAQWKGYPLPNTSVLIDALPAVFAREKLDIGTRQLLPWVKTAALELNAGARVLDLACGNGVLGIAALEALSTLDISFADVSSQAVASARFNAERAFPDAQPHFFHSDGVPAGAGQFDLILLNPPFHEGGVVGDHIAVRLLQQAARHLAPGGKLLMVGNRHLGYHKTLKRFFRQTRQLAADAKFVVFEARHQEAGRS